VTWERAGERQSAIITPAAHQIARAPQIGLVDTVGQIRVGMDHLRPIIHVAPGSTAEAAGLRSWDRILAVDGEPFSRWYEVERRLRSAAGGSVTVSVTRLERGFGSTAGVEFDAFASEAQSVVLAIPTGAHPLDGLGLAQSEAFVFEVEEGTPAADQLQLQPGDRLLALDGEPVQRWRYMLGRIHEAPQKERMLKIQRGGEVFTRPFTPMEVTVRGEFNNEAKKIVFGAENFSEVGFPEDVVNEHLMVFALHRAFGETWESIRLNLYAIGGLFVGTVPMDQLGGPIFIGQLAAKTGEKQDKARWFFGIMVMLSINLGLLNLLPIPMLDGGHLMFFAIEAVKRSPVSLRTRQIAAYVGLSFILMLMVLVFKNDLSRLFDTL
jgi:regulator of sigma E protease